MSHQPRPASRRHLVLGILVALIGILAAAPIIPAFLLAAQQRKEVKVSSPLVLVPDNTTFVMHIRVADLAKSDVFKLIVPAQEQPRMLQAICFGLPVEQVDTVTIATYQSPLLALVDPRAQFDFFPHRHPSRSDFKDKDRFFDKKDFDFKDGFKDKFEEKLPAKDKESARRATRTVPVAFQGGDKDNPPQIKDLPKRFAKDFAKDDPFKEFGPPKSNERGPDFGVLIVTMRNDLDVEDPILMRFDRAFKSKKGRTMLEMQGLVYHRLTRRTLVGAISEEDLDRYLDRPIPESLKGALAPALELAKSGKHTLTIGQAIPEKVLNEAVDERQFDPDFHFRRTPPGLVRTIRPLLAARPGVVTLNLGKNLAAAAEFHYADEAAAKKAIGPIQDVAVLLRVFGLGVLEEGLVFRGPPLEEGEMQKAMFEKLLFTEVEDALRSAKVEKKGNTVRVAAELPMSLDAIQDKAKLAVKEQLKSPQFLEARRRAASSKNLKDIVIALHSHHDTYRLMPPQAICDPNGKPLLSWRVAILPFIEEFALYKQFRLNEPWDSEHNIKLLEKMPSIYAAPGMKTKEPYTTFYQGFAGPNTGFELRPAANMQFGARGIQLLEFPDGTSNVWLVAEAAEPVPWSKPADMKYDPKGPLPKLGGLFAPGFHAAFADGIVRFYPRPLAADTMRIVITRNNGIPRPPEARD